jgi:hypothetical protein
MKRHRRLSSLSLIDPIKAVSAVTEGSFGLYVRPAVLKYLVDSYWELWYHKGPKLIDWLLNWHLSNISFGFSGFVYRSIATPEWMTNS